MTSKKTAKIKPTKRRKERTQTASKSRNNPVGKKDSGSKSIKAVTFFFVGLFCLMIAYLVYFCVAVAPEVIDNPYNKRIDNQDVKIVRGDILAADGTVLATTKKDADKREYRYYPYGSLYCHAVGLKTGKTGVEGAANFELLSHQSSFWEQIASDIKGEKRIGNNVITTLVPKLQQAAFDALGTNKGAVLMMEPSTGKILALVSKPDYNPNEADANYQTWLTYAPSDSVLLNRATQGLYVPGSTFKIVTALAYITQQEQFSNYRYQCRGSMTAAGGTTIPCIHMTVHHEEDLRMSFANSCNTSFANLGLQLETDRFAQLCDSLLFNTSLPAQIETVKSSFVLNGQSSVSDIQETAIGQGKTMISPLHNLMITACIANHGIMMKPYLIDAVTDAKGNTVSRTVPQVSAVPAAPQDADTVAAYMRAVVTDGTGAAFTDAGYAAAGKTGTAQFGSEELSHSWFVGFAPYENPRVAVCVLLEGGYHGKAAQYVARDLLDCFFEAD